MTSIHFFAATQGLDWWRWLGLAVVFGSLVTFWYLARRGTFGATGLLRRVTPQIEILETRDLGQRTRVALIRLREHEYLLASQNGGGLAWQPLPPTAHAEKKEIA